MNRIDQILPTEKEVDSLFKSEQLPKRITIPWIGRTTDIELLEIAYWKLDYRLEMMLEKTRNEDSLIMSDRFSLTGFRQGIILERIEEIKKGSTL